MSSSEPELTDPQRNVRPMISQRTLAKPAEITQTFRACLWGGPSVLNIFL